MLMPLRIPAETNLAAELEQWLQHIHASAAGTNEAESQDMAKLPLAEECRNDLERLAKQRSKVRKLLLQGYQETAAHKDVLWTYAKLLAAFAGHGFAAVLRKEYKKKHRRRSDTQIGGMNDSAASLDPTAESPPIVSFGWSRSNTKEASPTEDCMLWEWEQANVWWTLAVLEVYQAQQLALTAKTSPTWKKVTAHYTAAATWMAWLQQEYFGATALSNQQPTQYLWSIGHTLSWEGLQLSQALWTATAQRIGVEVFNQTVLKAKISAGAGQAYEECKTLLKENDNDAYWSAWLRHIEVWIPYCQAVSQAHQAAAHTTKHEFTLAYQRYRRATELGEECQALLNSLASNGNNLPHQVTNLLGAYLPEWQGKCAQIVEETPLAASADYDASSLPPIPPQKVTKMDLKTVTKQVESTVDGLEPPVFANLLSPDMRSQVHSFQAQMETLLKTTVRRAEEKAEAGRRALAIHNLPHALTAYQQGMGGGSATGGLPDEVWEKIDALQQSNKMNMLQQELWELKDMADMTQQTFKKINTLLDDDLNMDQEFRRQHRSYTGHNVEAVQTKYRQALQNYRQLMETASNSDAQLLKRLEELPMDTKFKLLTKSKAQLDCLLPATAPQTRAKETVDVTPLSQALAALSDLFRERDELVQELTTAVRKFNLMEFVQEVAHDPPEQTTAALQGIFQSAQESLQDMVQDIQQNMLKQTDFVKKALDENVKFVKAREEQEKYRQHANITGGSANTNRTLVMIHQAIEEVEELSKYLEEGKAFYNVVLPKLRRLQQNVEDLSTRLMIARLEYEDKERLSKQEAEDAQMAATMAGKSGPGGDPPGSGAAALPSMSESRARSTLGGVDSKDPPEAILDGVEEFRAARRPESDADDPDRWEMVHRPGAEEVAHDTPDVRVDDAKVAHLVGMDFDADRVVAALKKYDNNLEEALNELLTS